MRCPQHAKALAKDPERWVSRFLARFQDELVLFGKLDFPFYTLALLPEAVKKHLQDRLTELGWTLSRHDGTWRIRPAEEAS